MVSVRVIFGGRFYFYFNLDFYIFGGVFNKGLVKKYRWGRGGVEHLKMWWLEDT